MEGDGDDNIRRLPQLRPVAAHPVGHRAHRMQAVAVLEAEDEASAGIVVHHRAVGAGEVGRKSEAFAADSVGLHRNLERRAAYGAPRGGYEVDRFPAGGAQRLVPAHRAVAVEAQRGEEKVEDSGEERRHGESKRRLRG